MRHSGYRSLSSSVWVARWQGFGRIASSQSIKTKRDEVVIDVDTDDIGLVLDVVVFLSL